MRYFVYILTNWNHRVLYVGMTSNLPRRMFEHQQELADGFTKRYHIHKLVYFEETSDVNAAIAREKQLKNWSRSKKNELIERENPNWDDLKEKLEI